MEQLDTDLKSGFLISKISPDWEINKVKWKQQKSFITHSLSCPFPGNVLSATRPAVTKRTLPWRRYRMELKGPEGRSRDRSNSFLKKWALNPKNFKWEGQWVLTCHLFTYEKLHSASQYLNWILSIPTPKYVQFVPVSIPKYDGSMWMSCLPCYYLTFTLVKIRF